MMGTDTYWEAYIRKRLFLNLPECPEPNNVQNWKWVSNTTCSGIILEGPSGKWVKKDQGEIDMIEAMKEVDNIAPGWKDE